MADNVESISEALARLASEAPDRPALTVGDATVTRVELERRSNRLARAFAAEGVGHDDLVTIGLPNSIEFVESAIACWKLGAVPQPVSWRLPPRELQAIVDVADSALVVGVEPDLVPGRAAWSATRIPDESLGDAALPTVVASTWKAPTSGGSTGRPKLILSGEPAVVPPEPRSGMQRNGCVLIPGPLYHNAPFTFGSLGLFHGCHLVLLPRFDAEATLQAIDQHRPDFALVVPTMMIRLLRLPGEVRSRYDIASLRTVWHMGAPCPPWVKEAWIDWMGAEVIWEAYAGTEGQAFSTIRGDDWLKHRGSVGRVNTGEMKIVDPDSLRELAPGEVGEIFLRRSPGTPPTYRYLGAEAYTIGDGWESLGDMGWFDEDGYLFLTDRRADMILSGGANIYPAEIEAALNEHPGVQSCAVIGLPDDELGQVVHAVLQPTPGAPAPDDAELRDFVGERLVRYKVPRSFEWIDEPVRDDAGKVRRSALRDAADDEVRAESLYVWDDDWLAQRIETAIDPDVSIVDPHHHLWAHEGMGRYLLAELHADTAQGHNVESTVFVECQWGYRSDGPEQLRPVGETETIASIAEDSIGHGAEIKGIVGFADLTLGDAVGEVLEAHVAAGRGRFRGVRHPTAFDDDRRVRPRPHTRPGPELMADPMFRRGVKRLAAYGLSFDVWLYHPQIHELTALARAVPECSFVLDHLGAPLGIGPYEGKRNEILERWRLDIAELATCPNVAMKLGGIGMVMYGLGFQDEAEPPSSEELADAWGGPIGHVIEQFGADRCMFESNFPADKMSCSYVTLWNAFKRVVSGASSDEKAALLHGTASRTYRL